MTTTTNGRTQRTSLAQQIDRLDLILDNLSEGLQEAVADAGKTAVTRVVEAALVEVLTNPELRRHLAAESPGAQARPTGTCWTKAAGFAHRCWQSARLVLSSVWPTIQTLTCQALLAGHDVRRRLQCRLTSVARRLWWNGVEAARFFRQVRRSLGVALGIGVLVGVGCFVAGPLVASAVSGFAGFVASLATGLRWRRPLERGQLGVSPHSRGL